MIKEVRENDRKARLLAINKYSIINDELKEATIETFDFHLGNIMTYGKRALNFIEMVTNFTKGILSIYMDRSVVGKVIWRVQCITYY